MKSFLKRSAPKGNLDFSEENSAISRTNEFRNPHKFPKTEQMIIATLVYVFGAVLCLGAAFSGLLWNLNRNQLYQSQFFLWFWAIVSFVLQGAYQNLEMSGFLAYSINGLSVLAVISVLRESFSLNLNLRRFFLFHLLATIISATLFKLEIPFWLSALPFSVSTACSLLYVAFVGLRGKRAAVARGFSFLLILNAIHFLDYPLLRPHPEFAVAGFAIALCFYFTYAVFIPLTLTKIMGDRYSETLEAKVLERTGTLLTANSKLESLQEDLTVQYQNLQALVEDNRMLMSVLVHDIATPLSVMDGSITMLESSVHTEVGQKNLARIGRSLKSIKDLTARAREDHAQRLGKMTLPGNISTTNLQIDLSAPHPAEVRDETPLPQAKHAKILPFVTVLQKFGIEQVILEAIENFEAPLLQKNLKIKVVNLAGREIEALGDEQPLKQQVFGNLISNAIKFSHVGGTIQITIDVERAAVLIKVKDDGVGVPDDMFDVIFASDSPTSTIGTNGEVGTGLGLPIVRHFARKMGGEVRLLRNSGAETGACFEVKLKLPA